MILKSIDVAINGRFLEAKAKATVYPGMLLERYEDGVQPHSVEGGIASPLIAMESRFVGSDIHTPYEVEDIVYMRYCLPGDVFWGRLSAYTPGMNRFLWSAGVLDPGYLKVASVNPSDSSIVGIELESLNMSSYGFFVKVETI